jgi:hypothetical protein
MTDTTAPYDWTGQHKFSKQAARGAPSMVTASLQGGVDIVDSAILLKDNYVAAHDIRKNTAVNIEAPVSRSWGGNFGTYIQHKVSGRAPQEFGTLTGGIRAQLETTQEKNGSHINDACAAYFGVYNAGVDVGAFGIHTDAYHHGFALTGHSTYAFSAECWKQVSGGVMVSYVARAQEGKVDYGLAILHSMGTFGRGIQLGNPSYGQGGVQGSPGTLTQFDVGIDLTHGKYTTRAAIMVPSDDYVVLSGEAQAQDARIADACQMRFDSVTGMFAVRNGDANRFDVNMSNGMMWQNGNPTWGAFCNNVQWAYRIGEGKTAPSAGSAQPVKWLRIEVDGEQFVTPLYRA